MSTSRGSPKAASGVGSPSGGGVPPRRLGGTLTQAAALSLHGPQQEAVFQELDELLREATDRKQRDYGSKLEQEIVKTLGAAATCRREAERIAWCEDLQAPVDTGRMDAGTLFAELDVLVKVKDPTTLPNASRFGNFEVEFQGLLDKVAFDKELLTRQFPIEELTAELEPLADVSTESISTRDMPDFGSPGPRAVFEELRPLLDNSPGAMEEHWHDAETLAAQMTSFAEGVRRLQEDTQQCVGRLLRGEGSDGHPVDQEHAAWRRKTLQMLQKGPAAKAVPSRGRRGSVVLQVPAAFAQKTTGLKRSGLQRSASLTFASQVQPAGDLAAMRHGSRALLQMCPTRTTD